ncbi:MAG: DUF1116 domain-containing protein [Chloroflexi bacterium]|nr:DUF1116 domain-containing protein [Chloroflexota bacterium]MCL5074068.1 DUF1116 domain-containing protein [Chloroflexota bacterium]
MNVKDRIEEANKRVLEIIHNSNPLWTDVRPAREVIPGMQDNLILHAGPPIEWERMCSAQRNGVIGAVIYEGLASSREEAEDMVSRGEILIEPCHEHQTVGSMTGITSASMPVMVVEDATYGNAAYILVHEGPSRQRLSYGAFNEAVLQNLRWIEHTLGPALGEVVQAMGGLPINPIIARALTMGDECHNRPVGGTSLFIVKIAPYLVRTGLNKETIAHIFEFLGETEHFFFHLAMAGAKATADAASGVAYSTVVTAMARNSIETGIRVSGLGDRWFTGPASTIDGVFFPGYGSEDAEADMGDSAITETMGLGAFALAASLSMVQAVGDTTADAIRYQKEMEEITIGKHNTFRVPMLDFEGTPVGIDIRKVVDSGILPIIDTAIAHKEGGQIGVGLARPPMECFTKALQALGEAVLV